MKLFHALKGGKKVNEIPLTDTQLSTRHKIVRGEVTHEGWGVTGTFEEKGHKYTLMFDVNEAVEFHAWLGKMLERFKTKDVSQFIVDENHD